MAVEEREPTREELEAMAYADGELAGEARRAFEALLAVRPDLRLEVARLRRLEILARSAAGPEPIDHEWKALARDPLHRGVEWLGLALLALGGLGVAGWGVCELWTSEVALLAKLALSALALGAVLSLAIAWRARSRTRPHDPYTEIQR